MTECGHQNGWVTHVSDLAPAPRFLQSQILCRLCKSPSDETVNPELRSCVKVEVAVLAPRPNEPYGFCGRKATFYHGHALVTVCP